MMITILLDRPSTPDAVWGPEQTPQPAIQTLAFLVSSCFTHVTGPRPMAHHGAVVHMNLIHGRVVAAEEAYAAADPCDPSPRNRPSLYNNYHHVYFEKYSDLHGSGADGSEWLFPPRRDTNGPRGTRIFIDCATHQQCEDGWKGCPSPSPRRDYYRQTSHGSLMHD